MINAKKADRSYRIFNNINRLASSFPHAATGSGERVTVWCANDYLGMSRHPMVLSTMQQTLDVYGAGAGGTRNISGNGELHLRLEQSLADLHDQEAALIFSSCFVANDATLSTLCSKLPGCVIFSDEMNHASMIQGIRNSRAKKHVYRHNDLDHLESLLKQYPVDTPKLIAFESVYSMSGSIGKIKETIKLAKKYNALTFLDEVHAVGMYGRRGGGVAEILDCMKDIDIITGTLGKAYGVVGGYIAGNQALVDMVRCYAPGFIFTTSLPPAIVAGALTSVEYLKSSSEERRLQQIHTRAVKHRLARHGIPVIPNPSHIIPVLVGDADLCKKASDRLLQVHGIYVQSINFPTVPVGEERLRITPTPGHTPEMMEQLERALEEVWVTLGLKRVWEWQVAPRANVGNGYHVPMLVKEEELGTIDLKTFGIKAVFSAQPAAPCNVGAEVDVSSQVAVAAC